ncbi:uncharacterized protein FOMMEDRAFT_171265 [Fomitiporia mediterranea MF3/22]|uniref:uncharacterized protein n=1 Tax=Fomitiporia mediterranea (strain MF3/22) TaxID=694068 RepID=UPI0004409260|nr:uncharacterized protein FOMMEDRAFT_171265 [Fomitiporia mediterranea MF3/22]EJC97852.1 hypothetical protein FOMMEDRAFT_171265 [Fomitiporia mediterranea MF3/22]
MAKAKLASLVSRYASRLKRREPARKQRTPQQLADMPVDVILEVFLHLEFTDVMSLAQVSRLFYEVSESLAIWKNLAYKLMCRGRRISLHDHLSTSSLTAAQLKQSVLLTTAAEESWLGATPTHVARPHPVRLDDVDLDHASYIMKFTSRRHLVLPTKAGELVGWDTRTKTCAGKYDMGADSVLINVQGDYATRSLYWITGKISSDPDFEQNLHIKILRIQFPEPSSSNPVGFEVLGDLVTPWSLAAELHFLDASQRMICAVFLNEETCTAGLHVVLDWSTGLSCIFDTGTIYEYGRAVIGLHLSTDKQHIILRSEQCGMEVRRAYSLNEMKERAFIWNAARRSSMMQSLPCMKSVALALTRWEHEDPAFDYAMAPHTVWVLPQWWPTLPGVPRRTSTIILYLAPEDGPMGQMRRVWRAAQHYSEAVESVLEDDDELVERYELLGCSGEMVGGAPCSSARSIVDIGGNAVTISLGHHGLPILAQSFNHLGWIEETYEDDDDDDEKRFSRFRKLRPKSLFASVRRRTRSRSYSSASSSSSSSSYALPRRCKRTLKLVTFPDPGVSPIHPHNCKISPKPKNNNRTNKPYNDIPTANYNSNKKHKLTNLIHHLHSLPLSLRHLKFQNILRIGRMGMGMGIGNRMGRARRREKQGECTCTILEPVTLDVPAEVLDGCYHMFLDPAAGTVTLATEDNELHVYQYGRPGVLSSSFEEEVEGGEEKRGADVEVEMRMHVPAPLV